MSLAIVLISLGKATLLGENMNFPDAAKTLLRMFELSYKKTDEIFSVGIVLGNDGCEELLKICEDAIVLAPKNSDAILCRGALNLLKSNFDDAITDFSEVISMAPENPAPHFFKGFAYSFLNEPKMAIESVGAACALDFGNKYFKSFYKRLKKCT